MPLKIPKRPAVMLSLDHPEAGYVRPVFVGKSGERIMDERRELRNALRQLRWTRAYFADRVGHSIYTVRDWFYRVRIPDVAFMCVYRGQQEWLAAQQADAGSLVTWDEVPSVASLDGGIDRRFPDASTMAARVARRSGGHAASLVRACQMLADMADTADRAESVRVFFRSLR